MIDLSAILIVVAWGIICVLIAVLYRIARFYQILSGRRSYYQFFGVPLVLLALGALASAVLKDMPAWGDLLMLLGGAILIGLGYYLQHLMLRNRP